MADDSHAGCQGGVGHSQKWVLGAMGVEMIEPGGFFKQKGDALGSWQVPARWGYVHTWGIHGALCLPPLGVHR